MAVATTLSHFDTKSGDDFSMERFAMSEKLIFGSLLWLLMAGTTAWSLLSVFREGCRGRGDVVGRPGVSREVHGIPHFGRRSRWSRGHGRCRHFHVGKLARSGTVLEGD